LHGEVILYADVMTQSIQKFLAVSKYRAKNQIAYNEEHSHHAAECQSRGGRQPRDLPNKPRHGEFVLREGGWTLTEDHQGTRRGMLDAAQLEFEKAP